jgi:CheY-like chemotaxis protein
MKILIVEDNVKLAGYIKMAFENKSYVVDIAYDGEIGEKKAFYNEYMASGVAAQRIYSDKHWTSDVIAGAFIGTMVGRDLTNRYNKSSSLSLLPIPGGLSLAYRF